MLMNVNLDGFVLPDQLQVGVRCVGTLVKIFEDRLLGWIVAAEEALPHIVRVMHVELVVHLRRKALVL